MRKGVWPRETKRKMAGDGCVTVVLGGQWGDEGKGKLVDILAQDADLVCRAQVNHNSKCPGDKIISIQFNSNHA